MAEKKPSLSQYAAREIRRHLGGERTSVAALARKLGWTQSYLARRVDGRVAFDLDDLEKVAAEIGIRVMDLLPTEDAANTLRNRDLTDSPRSAAISPHGTTDRPPSAPNRQRTRPARTTPKAGTRRPAFIARPVHAA